MVTKPSHLLDDQARCAVCAGQLSVELADDSLLYYVCGDEDYGQVWIQADALEAAVTVQVFTRLSSPTLRAELERVANLAGMAEGLEKTRHRLRDLDDQYAAGKLDRAVYLEVRRQVYATGEGLRRIIDDHNEPDFGTITTEGIGKWWINSPIDRRRELLALLVDHIDVQPGPGQRDEDYDPEPSVHVSIAWRED